MGQYGGTVHSHWVTSQLHIWAIAALLTSPSLVAGCAITPPLPTTQQLLYLEMSRDTSAKNEPRNTPIHVTELVIIYLEIHSPYISKAISRIFSWSIVKCFEPRKCFWDSEVSTCRTLRRWTLAVLTSVRGVIIYFRTSEGLYWYIKLFCLSTFLYFFFW